MMNRQLLAFFCFVLITRLNAQALALASVTATPSFFQSHETAGSEASSSKPITAEQYCTFLNAVAATDEHQLYCEQMGSDPQAASIVRSGNAGAYEYSVITGKENASVPYLTWSCAARYCNWIENSSQATGNRLQENETETGAYDLKDADDIVISNSTATCTILGDENSDPLLACGQVNFSVVIPSNHLTLWSGGDNNDLSGYDIGKGVLITAGIIAAIVGVRYAFSGCYGEPFEEPSQEEYQAIEAHDYNIGTGFNIEQIDTAHTHQESRPEPASIDQQESRTKTPSNSTASKDLVTRDLVNEVVIKYEVALKNLPKGSDSDTTPENSSNKSFKWNESACVVFIPTRLEDYESHSEHFSSLSPDEQAKHEPPGNFDHSSATPEKGSTKKRIKTSDIASAPQVFSDNAIAKYKTYYEEAVPQAESKEEARAKEARAAIQDFKFLQQHYWLAKNPEEFATREKTSTTLKKDWLQARTHTRWMKMALEKFNNRDNPSYHLSWKDEADWTAWADLAINRRHAHRLCWQDWHQWKNDEEHQEWHQENSRRIATYPSFRTATKQAMKSVQEDPDASTNVKKNSEAFYAFLPCLEKLNATYETAFSQFYKKQAISRRDFETAFHHYNDSLQKFSTDFKDVIAYVDLFKSNGDITKSTSLSSIDHSFSRDNEDAISSELDVSSRPSSPGPEPWETETLLDNGIEAPRENSFNLDIEEGRTSPDKLHYLFETPKILERRNTISTTKNGVSIEMPDFRRNVSAP